MSLAIATVVDSIEALEVTGLNIAGIDNIPPDCKMLTPILIPEPLNFVTNFLTTRDTFGTSTTAEKTAEYDLNYTFLYAPLGSGRTGLEYYGEMLEMAGLIVDEILDNDTITGCVDISPQGTVDFGPVPDPSGNQYLGCRLVFHVVEYL